MSYKTVSALSLILILAFFGLLYYMFYYKKPAKPQEPVIKYSDDLIKLELVIPPRILSGEEFSFSLLVQNAGDREIEGINVTSISFPREFKDLSLSVNPPSQSNKCSFDKKNFIIACKSLTLDAGEIVEIDFVAKAPEVDQQKTFDLIFKVKYPFSIVKTLTLPVLNKRLKPYTNSKPVISKDMYAPIGIEPSFDIRNFYLTPSGKKTGEWVYSNQPFNLDISFYNKASIKPENIKAKLAGFEIKVENLKYGDCQPQIFEKVSNTFKLEKFGGEKGQLCDVELIPKSSRKYEIDIKKVEEVYGFSACLTTHRIERFSCIFYFQSSYMPEYHPKIEIVSNFIYQFLAVKKLRVVSVSAS